MHFLDCDLPKVDVDLESVTAFLAAVDGVVKEAHRLGRPDVLAIVSVFGFGQDYLGKGLEGFEEHCRSSVGVHYPAGNLTVDKMAVNQVH
ncbi:MAG: hypothetical protein ACXW13_00120 [Burkholderiaceae bacterium]